MRNREQALEAPEMGVAWDYTAFIVHMATALLVTALISESVQPGRRAPLGARSDQPSRPSHDS